MTDIMTFQNIDLSSWDTLYIWHTVHDSLYSTRSSCQISMKLAFFLQVFEKYSNIKCYENPSSGGWVVPRGSTDGQTDMTKLVVAFCSFENKPKNGCYRNMPYALPPTVTLCPVHVLLCHYALFMSSCDTMPCSCPPVTLCPVHVLLCHYALFMSSCDTMPCSCPPVSLCKKELHAD